MPRVRPILAALVLVLLLAAGARSLGPLPPLGGLLDPTRGVWAAALTADLPPSARARIPGLVGEVRVVYDDRSVPHIFASTPEDAYRALGYVVARDRLFQLELQTLAASGRLTEVAGARALPVDQEMRALGMGRVAERRLAALDTAAPGTRAIVAYADGVNAWIAAMRPRQVPIEYRLLGARPSRWAPINSLHLLNRMSWTLSYTQHELDVASARALVGRAAADALFPVNSPIQEPIVPTGATAPRFDARPIPPPGPPDTSVSTLTLASLGANGPTPKRTAALDAMGSNNWAVAPSRTASKHALLAGDPHLELTLPSIWYEAHLVVPGVFDVYGVTIPGAPWIIIGFNRDVAWTFTNADADLVDYYAETVDDLKTPTRYRLDGQWHPLELRIERYRDVRGNVVATDTIRFTHRGPLLRADDRWLSMRWTLYEPDEPGVFGALAVAKTAAEALEGMRGYVGPPQNILVADRDGHIAIRTTGLFPVRPGDGRGDVIRDGSLRTSDWRGFLPVARYPTSVDPAQGFLASANQQHRDPRQDSTYLGSNWYSPWRAMRINALLRADSSVTPDAMRRFQTDPGSARADVFVPALLEAATRAIARDSTDEELRTAMRLLSQWDRRYTRENERALLFERAMDALADLTWDELDVPGRTGRRALTPEGAVLATLLRDADNLWWDVRATTARERRDDILVQSLRVGYRRAREEHGPPERGGWRWRDRRHANIRHLMRLDGFSALGIPMQGGPSTLNPSSGGGGFGASWRMVVELGPELRAWGVYPGGQSGNPASPRYADRMSRWSDGVLDTLRIPDRADALTPAQRGAVLTLEPER